MRRLSVHALQLSAVPRTLAGSGREAVSADGGPVPDAAEPTPASQEAETFRQAYLEGFEAGRADGDREARQVLAGKEAALQAAIEETQSEAQRWRERLGDILQAFEAAHGTSLREAEELAVEVGFAAACRLLGKAQADRSLVAALCVDLLKEVPVRAVRVHLASGDAQSVGDVCGELEIVSDPSLKPGDCIVRTPRGDVDGGIETRLRALLDALLASLGRAEPA